MVTQNESTYNPQAEHPYSYAPLYYQTGWTGVLPVTGKSENLPEGFTGYNGESPETSLIAEWIVRRKQDNICLRLPKGVIGIDCDNYRDGHATQTLAMLRTQGIDLLAKPTWKSTSRAPSGDDVSGIYLYRLPEHFECRTSFHSSGMDSGIEVIQFHHRYMVVAPSIHPGTGQRYRWYAPDGQGGWSESDRLPSLDDLAVIDDPDVLETLRVASSLGSGTVQNRKLSRSRHGTRDVPALDGSGNPVDPDNLLSNGIPTGIQNNELYRYLCSSRARGQTRQEMITLGWSVLQKSENEPGRELWTKAKLENMVDAVRNDYPPGSVVDPETAELARRIYENGSTPNGNGQTELPSQIDETRGSTGSTGSTAGQEATNASGSTEYSALLTDVEQWQRRLSELRNLDAKQWARHTMFATEWSPPEVTTMGTFLRQRPSEEPQLVDTLIGAKHNVLLAAQYKAGKTTLALNLVKSLVHGEDFLGQPTKLESSASIAWFNAEMDVLDFYEYAKPLGIPDNDRIPLVHLRGSKLPLLDDRIRDWTVRMLHDNNVKVWVIDSWRRVLTWSGVKENDNDEVSAILTHIEQIKLDAGVDVVVMLAHFGRKEHEDGAEHVRGASDFDAWVDTRWLLTKENGGRFLKTESRTMRDMEETQLTFDQETHRISLGVGNRKQQRYSTRMDVVVRIVTETPRMNKTELVEAIKGTGEVTNQSEIYSLVTAALRANKIHLRQGPAHNVKLHFPGPDPLLSGAHAWAESSHDDD